MCWTATGSPPNAHTRNDDEEEFNKIPPSFILAPFVTLNLAKLPIVESVFSARSWGGNRQNWNRNKPSLAAHHSRNSIQWRLLLRTIMGDDGDT